MTGRELKCLGMALKALMKNKMYADVEEILDTMTDDEKIKDEKKEQKS